MIKIKKKGAPMSDVTAPTGRLMPLAMVLEIISEISIIKEPNITVVGINILWL